ncbi:MAG TPA: hypothetical protein VLC98_14295 [Phnomibacter sp.]|nr:hypothetical protein [Phnomibacter sp.]
MKGINALALLALNLLAVVFAYKRHDFSQQNAVSNFWGPLLISVLGFNFPALFVSGVNYLINKKFNSSLFNNICYFVIGFILLIFFFPDFMKMG